MPFKYVIFFRYQTSTVQTVTVPSEGPVIINFRLTPSDSVEGIF